MIGKTISHYKIIEKLGSGGMGIVYKAQDLKLDRFVALKFLPPHLTSREEEKQRFIHEAKAASSLDHNNICAIHEIDETEDGQLFISMAYYEGETLDKRIKDKPLPIEDTIDIAIQIAQGLAIAHEKEIVHRDIKPANIMLTKKGVVKVLDFGLAKLSTQTKLTKESTTLGTISYMSPEQAKGEEVDYRTDIWSLGVIIYEMLTGQLPFKGEYESAVIYSIMNDTQEPVTGLRTGIPMELERIINKCLQKSAGNRYQHINELIVDLKGLKGESTDISIKEHNRKKHSKSVLISVAILSIIILFISSVSLIFYQEDGDESINSLAVLPFKNLSNDPNQEYFVDGITDVLISELGRIRALHVISRTSVMQYKGGLKSIATIASELNVDGIVEGTVFSDGNRVRITTKLIRTENDKLLWSENYEYDFTNSFSMHAEVVQAIAGALEVQLTDQEEAQLALVKKINPEAYPMYLKGRFFWNKRTREDLDKSLEYFQSAIEKDPTYAKAYAGLADAYSMLGINGYLPNHETIPKAKFAAKKALEIDSTLAEARITLAFIRGAYDYDLPGAEIEFKQALKLNPNYATGHQWYGSLLLVTGRIDSGWAELKRAQQLDPLSPIINLQIVQYFIYTKEFDKAIEEGFKIIDLNPEFPYPYFLLGFAYEQKGMAELAFQQYRKFYQIMHTPNPQQIEALDKRYDKEGLQGFHKFFFDIIKTKQYTSSYDLAMGYAFIGETDSAFSWLEKAYEKRDGRLMNLGIGIFWENLRSDPRYINMLQKIGLKP